MTQFRFRLAAVALCGLCALGAPAGAVSTQVWRDSRIQDFGQGNGADVAFGGEGNVRLAPASRVLAELKDGCVWATVADGKGHLYVGTGPNGVIYRITQDAAGKATTTEFYRSTEMHILSLALDKDGNLYAGTAPHGQILRIAPDGAGSVAYETGAVYVWALLFDDKGGLCAGTGKEGRVLRYSPAGAKTLDYATGQKHVLCLLLDGKGNLYAGAGQKGVLYRFDTADKASVLFEASQPEIHGLTLNEKETVLFAATASGWEPPPATPKATGPAAAAAEEAAGPPKEDAAPPAEAKKPAAKPAEERGNAVYEVDLASGTATPMVVLPQMSFFSLAWYRDRLYAGSGHLGWLFTFDEAGIHAAIDRPEREVLALRADPKLGLILGTANGASVVAIQSDFAAKGEFVSRVLDGGASCRWGRARWRAVLPPETALTVATRSGNIGEPGPGWSDWQPVAGDDHSGEIKSPTARFLQYRATFTTTRGDASPRLDEMTIAYLSRNLPPRIKDITVSPPDLSPGKDNPGDDKKKGPAKTAIGRGQARIAWQADDPNGDKLRCDLFCRTPGEAVWKKLAENVKGSEYIWNTESVPDGPVVALLRVSDAPGNAPEDALTAEKVGAPVVIDNGRPTFEVIKMEWQPLRRCRIDARAVDQYSRITRIEYAIDGGDWQPVQPEDGIYDFVKEEFVLLTPPLYGKEHAIILRAFDSAGNIGAMRVVARPPSR